MSRGCWVVFWAPWKNLLLWEWTTPELRQQHPNGPNAGLRRRLFAFRPPPFTFSPHKKEKKKENRLWACGLTFDSWLQHPIGKENTTTTRLEKNYSGVVFAELTT